MDVFEEFIIYNTAKSYIIDLSDIIDIELHNHNIIYSSTDNIKTNIEREKLFDDIHNILCRKCDFNC